MSSKLFILFLGFFLLSSCSWSNWGKVSPISSEEKAEVSMPVVSFDSAYEWLKSSLRSDTGFQACMSSQINMCAMRSVSERARQKDDIEICQELSDVSLQQSCEHMIIMSIAQKTKDESKCQGLKNEQQQQQCVSAIRIQKAQETKDIGLCEKIGVFTTWTWTATGSTGELSSERDVCILRVIQMTDKEVDPKVCEKVSETRRSNCESILKMKNTMLERQKKNEWWIDDKKWAPSDK